MTDAPLLSVENLSVDFHSITDAFRAAEGITFSVNAGETLVILGESGSGKSVSASAIMGILDTPPGEIVSGVIRYRGDDITHMTERRRRALNGAKVAIIFQDPLSHLNPVYTVGWQLAEVFTEHRKASRAEAKTRSIEILRRVGIPDPEHRVDWYPHQFSGGQRQRIMIGMAIALDPDLLIADEPTTALDVSVQAQILDLLKDLQREKGLGIIMITHDLEVAANMADRILVMRRGRIVEEGDARRVFERPADSYTRQLISALPAEHHYAERADRVADEKIILDVRNLGKSYQLSAGVLSSARVLKAVDDVSFTLKKGETLGIVGESGSGKSTVARMLYALDRGKRGRGPVSRRRYSEAGQKGVAGFPQQGADGVSGPIQFDEPAHERLHHHLRALGHPWEYPPQGKVARAGN